MNATCKSYRLLHGSIAVFIALTFVLTACTPVQGTTQTTAGPIVIETFEDAKAIFREIRKAEPGDAQARVDQLWQTLVDGQRVPLVLDTQVVFLYKGDAEAVTWSGSFNHWNDPGVKGVRLAKTDLWVGYAELPEASRAEYKIVLNGHEWIVDPANPNTTYSGLTGANSVVSLPGFTVTDESEKRSDIKQGTLTDDLSIESKSLGYTVNYRVYMPAGYEDLEKLPVIYVLDGNDFIDERMGALPDILDNMIADGRAEPVLAVFIDQRDPNNPDFNRREQEFIARPVEHANFVADELVPVIDSAYRTDPRPDARVIMGVSFGGLSATYIAAFKTDVFHKLAAFSPSLWVIYSPGHLSSRQFKDGSAVMSPTIAAMAECGGETGIQCPPIDIFITAGWPDWDVGRFDTTVAELQEKGYSVEFHPVREGHTWDHWRGSSDEMLVDFFGAD